MNQNSSNPSSGACSSENTTPELIELVQKFIREQFPDAHVSILYRWGKELRVNGITVGCIIKNNWETWHWERDKASIELDDRFGSYKIINDKRITEKSIHASDPSFFEIIKQDCIEVMRHGQR